MAPTRAPGRAAASTGWAWVALAVLSTVPGIGIAFGAVALPGPMQALGYGIARRGGIPAVVGSRGGPA